MLSTMSTNFSAFKLIFIIMRSLAYSKIFDWEFFSMLTCMLSGQLSFSENDYHG
jgi:hypothetical protein